MTNSLQQMSQRRDQWLNEKPQADFTNELRMSEGDVVWFQFVASGDDGDRFIKVYRAHSFEAFSSKGTRINPIRYCPRHSGEGTECPYCDQDNGSIKERMSIWMYIPNIFRAQLRPNTPPDQIPPLVTFEGRTMYNEQVNAFRIWHTSAWKDSPWADIIKLNEMHKGLHNFAAQLVCSGQQLNRRYKLYPLPNTSGISAELYQQAMQECKPIPEILKEQLAKPIQANPANNQQQQVNSQIPNSPNNAPIIPFTSPFGQQPTQQPSVTPTSYNPFQNPESNAVQQPATEPTAEKDTSPPFEADEASQPETSTPTTKLPLQSMF